MWSFARETMVPTGHDGPAKTLKPIKILCILIEAKYETKVNLLKDWPVE